MNLIMWNDILIMQDNISIMTIGFVWFFNDNMIFFNLGFKKLNDKKEFV